MEPALPVPAQAPGVVGLSLVLGRDLSCCLPSPLPPTESKQQAPLLCSGALSPGEPENHLGGLSMAGGPALIPDTSRQAGEEVGAQGVQGSQVL